MRSSVSLAEIATKVNGKIVGNADVLISGIADLRTAGPQHLVFLGNPKYLKAALQTKAGAILVSPEIQESFPCTQIIVENPQKAFACIAALFIPEPIAISEGVHPTAIVSSEAKIGQRVHIGPHAVVESGVEIADDVHIGAGGYIGHYAKIGAKTFLNPNVTIYHRCILGQRVILHAGVVIGADGFGYEFVNGRHQKIPQIGYVQIDDDVEIGANTTIDRGRFDKTWIQEGSKIDNLVMIGHNVVVGKHSIIVGQSGIAGSTHCGHYVTIAGQVGITGHITIGDKVTITAMSGVSKDCETGQIYSGIHARPIKESMKIEAYTHRLPELFERIKKLEKALDEES